MTNAYASASSNYGAASASISQSSGCKRSLDDCSAEASCSTGKSNNMTCAMDTSSGLSEASETKRNKTESDEPGTGMADVIACSNEFVPVSLSVVEYHMQDFKWCQIEVLVPSSCFECWFFASRYTYFFLHCM